MQLLTVRTDKPEAELGLYDGTVRTAYVTWQAHRQLAETIHAQIRRLLKDNNTALSAIGGIVVYEGPGSFTGLRIGIAVANALADSLGVPIVGSTGNAWQATGSRRVLGSEDQKIVLPVYGADVHITVAKK